MGKRTLNKLIRDEKGQALMIALVLMLVGGLIVTPVLGHMGTGLKAGQVFEERMNGQYAADAGVENALWRLSTGDLTVPAFTINGSTVNVTIEDKGNSVYKITSIASSDSSPNTIIEAFVSVQDFSFFLEHAVTSGGEVNNKGSIIGPIEEYYTGDWPSADVLSQYYLNQANVGTPFASGTLDVKDYPTILSSGPVYRQGDLEIINTGTAGAVGVLNQTVYVTGNLGIAVTNHALTLDLNNQTIFVEGNINLGTKECTIIGSGCIIAVGDITFSPDTDSNSDNFVFVMSLEHTVYFSPKCNFYGAVAGDVKVTLQPGGTITLTEAPGEGDGELNVPLGDILSWKVSP